MIERAVIHTKGSVLQVVDQFEEVRQKDLINLTADDAEPAIAFVARKRPGVGQRDRAGSDTGEGKCPSGC